ncbi:endonuclease/exonuclease/phosphatase family protein [Flavobacteriaceae bacterium LMO-SS05]
MRTSETEKKLQTLAFYNIENLFDIYDDEQTNDNDFLPTSAKKWTQKRYDLKIYKLASVISKIGFEISNRPPAIIGLAEVENDLVLRDLIQSEELSAYNYSFVHYDSTDERGIDVALLYNKDEFKVESSETFPLDLRAPNGDKDFTRDILLVTGMLDGDPIHVIVNHWPSRRDGEDETVYKRITAAKKVLDIIAKLKIEYESPKILIMGDFNDNPNNESVQFLMDNEDLFNSTQRLWTKERGSLNHDFKWNLFDQIIMSNNLINVEQDGYRFESAHIFDDKFLTQYHGKYQGQPFRTYVGKKYMGGFSDHFPVYIILKN